MNLKASKGVYMQVEEEEKEKGMIYNYTLKNKISYLKKCDSKQTDQTFLKINLWEHGS